MTAGLITQVNNPIAAAGTVQTTGNSDSGNNFLDVFRASADKASEKDISFEKQIERKNSQKAKESQNEHKPVEKDSGKKTTADSAKSEKKDEFSEEDVEKVQEATESIVDAMAQILDVANEAIQDALEELDLEETDLLDAANIPQVVVEIAGAEDVVDIMTDEALFEDVKEISELASDISANLAEELNVDASKVTDTAKEIVSLTDATEVETIAENALEKAKKNDNSNDAGDQMNFAQSFIDNIKAAAEQKGEVTEAYATDMNEIYNQVSESLKVSLSEDVTEMEINLHPASLGNVKIQIAERDGVITANFTTQNEQVKAALETQILELKENMSEQGIKVEAIEVTLASHSFEENLSKEGEHTSSENEPKKKRRSINLNEIEENDDIVIEDEIRIAREMMMRNGTTVDYMA